ncbi:MAG: hypothetical protein ACRDR6_18945 [Pseudonocardiaceae bacterium]
MAAALAGETTAVAQAVPGTRAHILFRSAARLGELVGAGVLDETLAAHALLAVAPISPSGANQFTRGEATGHITNGIARGRRNPGDSRPPTGRVILTDPSAAYRGATPPTAREPIHAPKRRHPTWPSHRGLPHRAHQPGNRRRPLHRAALGAPARRRIRAQARPLTGDLAEAPRFC